MNKMGLSGKVCLVVLVLTALAIESSNVLIEAAKHSSASASRSRRPPKASRSSKPSAATSPSKRKKPRKTSAAPRRPRYEEDEEEDDEEADVGFGSFKLPDDDVEEEVEEDDEYGGFHYDEEEEEAPVPRKRRPSGGGGGGPSRRPPPSASRSKSRKAPPPRRRYEEDDYEEEEDDYYGRPPPRRNGGGRSSRKRGSPPSRRYDDRPRGRVVPYTNQRPGAFARGLAAVRDNIPDASSVRSAALTSISAARHSTSRLSANIYREVKGLTSSELEQVMLKATRPDETVVKGKHVERLVGVTYQISGRYDIYDAVLRKLWAKMTEKDWRTKVKALYILHRFASDGAPEHQAALKGRLRELRRSQDQKRKDKYFNSKQLLAGEATPENAPYRAFLARYAHYVLLRAQCFGGAFDEIGKPPPMRKKAVKKPMTATVLRPEHLEAAKLVLSAGMDCSLKEAEVCHHTAIAVERVASDLMALSKSVATALNQALAVDDDQLDLVLLQKWCKFYSESLLPKTRSMVKKTTPKLDAFNLFLPARIGASVPQELLQKGLKGREEVEEDDAAVDESEEVEQPKAKASSASKSKEIVEEEEDDAGVADEEEPVDDAQADEEEEEEEDDDEEDDADFEYDEEYYDDE